MTEIVVLMRRAVRTRRFETLSIQDILQFVVVGLLAGCFWWQRGGHNTLAASMDTIGAPTLFYFNFFSAVSSVD